jgi:hypothetical protein
VNDHARLDAQVRSALAELPMPDDVETRAALGDVLQRSRTKRTAPRWVAPALVAAAVIAIVALVGTFVRLGPHDEPAPAASPLSRLLGDWERDVDGSTQPGWDGPWTMTFDRRGVFELGGPATADASGEGASYAVSGDTLRVDVFVNNVCSELPAGLYLWSRTGDVLTLRLVEDPCADRAALLAGSWRRP